MSYNRIQELFSIVWNQQRQVIFNPHFRVCPVFPCPLEDWDRFGIRAGLISCFSVLGTLTLFLFFTGWHGYSPVGCDTKHGNAADLFLAHPIPAANSLWVWGWRGVHMSVIRRPHWILEPWEETMAVKVSSEISRASTQIHLNLA